jgi:endonuclease/exonuclease/phosphatase family metal-dependent hydrolase
VRAYNVHWDHESQPSRERSASLLLARIGAHRATRDGIVVTGDFNSDEKNPAYRAVVSDTRTVLRDTYRARHPATKTVGTFNGFTGDSTGGKIDFILTGPGFETLDATIDRRRFGALWASDHFAVSAIVRR